MCECCNHKHSNTKDYETLILFVEGMSCEHCVNAVKNAVSSVDGVKDVAVDLDGGKVTIKYDLMLTDIDKVKEQITEAGYVI